jgi:Spherulation-specific family 4
MAFSLMKSIAMGEKSIISGHCIHISRISDGEGINRVSLVVKYMLILGYVILNPGCAPRRQEYFNIADLVIVYENYYERFRSPPVTDPLFNYLRTGYHGMPLMLPQSSSNMPSSKFGVMIHDFDTTGDTLSKLRSLVNELVQTKRVGAVFITDIKIKVADIYADWSSFWPEFVRFVAEADQNFLY